MYELTIRLDSGHADTETIGTYTELSDAIDLAWATPGFAGYSVGPAGVTIS